MRILIAGGTGALGIQLIPMLVAGGHDVTATTRTPAKMKLIHGYGATPVICDGLNREDVLRTVQNAKPHVVIHQMTALAKMKSLRAFDREFHLTNRLRIDGTRLLVEASRETGVRKIVAQSYSGWPNNRIGTGLKSEEDPLDLHPAKTMRKTLDAIRIFESVVTSLPEIEGVVLRYGSFYGPATSICEGGDIVKAIRKRGLPVIGSGKGVWSFIHIRDAAIATVAATERANSGVYNIVDDEPADVSTWLPYLAELCGAKAPRHLPSWLGRLVIGEAGIRMMVEARGSSNLKAKTQLAWKPLYGSWREGFQTGLR